MVTAAGPLDNTQPVALATDHESVVEAPLAIVAAVAAKLVMRTGVALPVPPLLPAAVTVTVVVADAVPQVSLKVVSVLSAAVATEPAAGSSPSALSRWQPAAPSLAHASVVVEPAVTLVAAAEKKVMLALEAVVTLGTVTQAEKSRSHAV